MGCVHVFDACLNALAPFGRIVAYGIASREPNTVETGRLMPNPEKVPEPAPAV